MSAEDELATGSEAAGAAHDTQDVPVGAVDPATGQRVVGESRWPMSIAVVTLMVFALIASSHLTFFPGPLLALTEGVLLLAILFGDPGTIDRQTPWLRVATVALVVVLLISTLGSTALLTATPLAVTSAAFLMVLTDGIFRPSSSVLYPTISHGPRDRPFVALTFDDGPDPQVTPSIL